MLWKKAWAWGLGAVVVGGVGLGVHSRGWRLLGQTQGGAEETASPSGALSGLAKLVPALETDPSKVLAGLDLMHVALDDDGATAPLPGGRLARLTLDPQLQRTAEAVLAAHHIPEAAIVMMDPDTFQVRAYASFLEEGPARDLCVEATAPAASVFKIITGSALVEHAGLSADTKQCYSGGEQRIHPSDLIDDPQRDRWCVTLAGAMGRSVNTVFARLAQKHLNPTLLEEMARGFGFGAAIPFDVPVQTQKLEIPSDGLGFARTAAGFWNTSLSPLGAAWISATVANGGQAVRPTIVKHVVGADRKVLFRNPEAGVLRRTLRPEVAEAVTTMMEQTVRDGTSYKAFRDASGKSFLPGIPVAGKTGTLTDGPRERFYTWFSGFAPSRPMPGVRPMALAVLVVNKPTWHVKANVLAREMFRAHFAAQGLPNVTSPVRTPAAPAPLSANLAPTGPRVGGRASR